MKRVIVLGITVLIAACRFGGSKPALPPPLPELATPRAISHETLAFVREHIKKSRGWREDEYVLSFMDERGGLLYVYIGYKADASGSLRLGSRNSFYVMVDEGARKVSGEGKLQ